MRGRTAALGPAVSWQDAGVSFARASELLRLARDGGIEDSGGLLLADTTSCALLLGVDRRLARDVADTALAPLDAETELSRERLRRPSMHGFGTAAGRRPWRRRCMCIHRRCATAWLACGSSSTSNWRIRTRASSSSWPCARDA